MILSKFLSQKNKDKIKKFFFIFKCRLRRTVRFVIPFENKHKKELNFAILCVKNTNYCDLVVNNINSLHFLNPRHSFVIYCDDLCGHYLKNLINYFDYSPMVKIHKVFGKGDMPWQKYKIETLIDASKKDYILTDADGFWHQEPEIVANKINILTLAYKIKDNINEKLIVDKLFNQPSWSDFGHYVTGFVYIPSSFVTVTLENDLRNFVSKILDSSLDFLEPVEIPRMKRLAEELAVNFAVQSNYTNDSIVTLKEKDGPGSNEKLQSLYYGCTNNINL